MSQCVWMLVQILGKKNSLITLARKIKVKSKMKIGSRGRLQDAMQVGNFMDNLSAVQVATANRPLFMISFNSNSSLFRVSFNFVNTCYFFVICSFSPEKYHYKENLRDGTNLSTRTEHPVPNAVTPRRFHCTYHPGKPPSSMGLGSVMSQSKVCPPASLSSVVSAPASLSSVVSAAASLPSDVCPPVSLSSVLL